MNRKFLGGTNAELKANLLDIHNQLLQGMDANNIDFVRLKNSPFHEVTSISYFILDR